MKHISVCLLFAIAVQIVSFADVTKLTAEDRKVLQDSSRFHEVHSTSDLPAAIVYALRQQGRRSGPELERD